MSYECSIHSPAMQTDMGFVSQNDNLHRLRVQVSLQSEVWNSKAILRLLGKYYFIYANVEKLLVKWATEKEKE